jgi:predicted amidohydrolase YtcJ
VTLALHAIGDAAVRAALDAFARWPAEARARLRPRIEHAQLVHPDDFGRFAALGVVASMQPSHAATDPRAGAAAVGGARGARRLRLAHARGGGRRARVRFRRADRADRPAGRSVGRDHGPAKDAR